MSTASDRIARHAVHVHGSLLGGALRTTLRGSGYEPSQVAEIVDHVGVNGTAEGCPQLADEDVEGVEALVIKHTLGEEFASAADWPIWTDSERWVPTPDAPPVPDGPFEPDPADVAWAAAVFSASLPPVCGGGPTLADLLADREDAYQRGDKAAHSTLDKAIHELRVAERRARKLHAESRTRAVKGVYSDFDHAAAGHAV